VTGRAARRKESFFRAAGSSLRECSDRLPERTGVYLFLDSKSRVLYVGKAANLKKRVHAYFAYRRDARPQIPRLMEDARELRFIVTETEREALILENNLIKENRPRYNICLKDDKTFQSLKITLADPYPKLTTVRRYTPDSRNCFFGPFCAGMDLKSVFRTILTFFQLRDCSESEFRRRRKTGKACMKYQIHQCSGPCAGHISREDYLDSAKRAVAFLKGKDRRTLNYLKRRVSEHSERLEYEQAARYHRKVAALEKLKDSKNAVAGFRGDADALGYHKEGDQVLFQVLIIRSGRIISDDTDLFSEKGGSPVEQLRVFLELYYCDPLRIPPEIWIDRDFPDRAPLAHILSERRGLPCRLIVPRRGARRRVLDLAANNARVKLEHRQKDRDSIRKLERRIRRTLSISGPVRHLEAFDVSHSSGRDVVGAKVSFRDFRPDKSEYRRYRILSDPGADDYKSLFEVLTRRIERGIRERRLPDLFLLDGGPGHLSVYERVRNRFGIDTPAVALAKETHAKSSRDRLYLPGRMNPLVLKPGNPVLLKFMEIRDEAHRFAISYHETRRDARMDPRRS
jgi:excinuclease ABC subunit C